MRKSRDLLYYPPFESLPANLSLDKIRAQAKRQAWTNRDGTTNFNPFGKLWSTPQSRVRDEEDGLSRTVSDGRVMGMSTADQKRRSQFERAQMPHHANTMPTDASPRDLESGGRYSPTQGGTQETSRTDTTTKSASTEDNLLNGSTEPRRRRMGGLLGKMHIGSKEEPSEPKDDVAKGREPHYTLWSQLQHTVFNSWINVLIVMAPVGIALKETGQNSIAVFVVNFIAIIPLAAMLSFATEEIALRTGETIGGLLNATFGNAVELIVSLFALFDNQIDIVQTSLIGSMLSNLLLVMGMCFLFGGLKRVEQHFNVTVAQTAASLLALAIASLIIPTVYSEIVGTPGNDPNTQDNVPGVADRLQRLTQMSRGSAVLLLLVYAAYLYFQLSTHADMYNAPSRKATRRKTKAQKKAEKRAEKAAATAASSAVPGTTIAGTSASTNEKADGDAIALSPAGGAPKEKESAAGIDDCSSSSSSSDDSSRNNSTSSGIGPDGADDDDDDEPEIPKLTKISALVTLAVSTALVAVCAEAMVDSIDAITAGGAVSREFVGLILLPIVGNAAEHATAVTVAVKDKMDLAIGVAVGSSMQIALLVLPLIVVIGWIAGKEEMNMAFDGFQVIVLFVSVLLVNYLIGDGKSHWLEGVLLNTLYLIIAVAAWYYPTNIEV